MMKLDLSKYAPPGLDLKWEKQFFLSGWGFSALLSLRFLWNFANSYNSLFYYRGVGGEKILDETLTMPNFHVLLDSCLWMYMVFATCMMLLIGYHYAYHYMGSKSIYTMRRLPYRWELHSRCITLPLIAAAILLASAFVTLLLWYVVYINFTPEPCMTPGQWTKLWEAVF